tara:strand:- start:540 stop:1274 length:735 start_codon:yes stop_codon:yes gene_type:complete
MICCIASKKRPYTKTHTLFEAADIETFHFVEPQEVNEYKTQPNVVNIENDARGLPYARNFILNWAADNSHEWIIVCDDDVTGFGFYDGRNNKRGAEIWHEILDKTEKMPFEIVGINYRQHAWHEKTAVSINRKFADGCVALKVPALKWRYTESLKMKSDRDFLLRTIKNGFGTVRFNKYYFDTPVIGTNQGGLHREYASKEDAKWSAKLVEAWHPYAKLTKRSGRIDAKVDIPAFARAHRKTVR